MPNRTLQANYFADDKDVYDLLAAARKKLTSQRLVEMVRARGLILSGLTDRDDLIEQISILPFGWHQLRLLIEATNTADRSEKMTSASVSGSRSSEDFAAALDLVREARQDRGETYAIEKLGGTVRILVKYSELDTSKTRLAQRTQRQFTIEIEPNPSGAALIRHQDQPRAQEIVSELIDALSQPQDVVTPAKIELAGISDATHRTQFFLQLIRGLSGFKFDDVKAVKASRLQPPPVDVMVTTTEEPEGADDHVDDDDDDAQSSDGIGVDEASFIAKVTDIALRGDGLLRSSQYSQFSGEGFFVRSIVWTATENNGPRVELEAGFDNADEGTGFSYSIRGIHGRKSDGSLKKTKSAPSVEDRVRVLRLLESAARTAMEDVVKLASSDPAGSSEDVT
jgi:hypothetical protein